MIHVGIDFDNTIVSYDHVFHRLAAERGLVSHGVPHAKVAIRDAIRALPEGELRWQELQAAVYGHGIRQAETMDGLGAFLEFCRAQGVTVSIISHKTRFAARDGNVDLHEAALGWLAASGLLEFERTGLSTDRVHFEPTRRDKIARIVALGCSHFVDDLMEVLADPDFPGTVQRIHLAHPSTPAPAEHAAFPLVSLPSWSKIRQHLAREVGAPLPGFIEPVVATPDVRTTRSSDAD
jgi:hypothetical protein